MKIIEKDEAGATIAIYVESVSSEKGGKSRIDNIVCNLIQLNCFVANKIIVNKVSQEPHANCCEHFSASRMASQCYERLPRVRLASPAFNYPPSSQYVFTIKVIHVQ